MKSSCYFIFNHSVLLCPYLYSINLHNSLRTHSILVLVLSTAEPSWTLFHDGFVSLTHGFSGMTDCKEQSRAVAYCRQPASTVTLGTEPLWDPWTYICSVSRLLFFFFFRCSSFDKKGGVGLFYNWCSLTTPYSTRRHIKVGDIYILYIFTKHKLTLSSTYRDICQCRILQQLMPQLI
jgi:hypothetical protein